MPLSDRLSLLIPAKCAAVTATQSVTSESFARIASRTAGVRSHIDIGVLRCASTIQVFTVAPSAAVTVTAIDCVCPGATATWWPLPAFASASAGVITAVAPAPRGTAATVTCPAPAGSTAL